MNSEQVLEMHKMYGGLIEAVQEFDRQLAKHGYVLWGVELGGSYVLRQLDLMGLHGFIRVKYRYEIMDDCYWPL